MGETRCMIIGAGNIGLQLLRLLSRDLSISLLDADESSLQIAREVRPDNLETFRGDATSRLFLEQAGVAEVDTVVITTTTETINIEIARVLHDHFNVPRVLAIGITQDGIRQLAGFDCEVEGIFKVSATGLRNSLEQRTKTVHGIGLGKNEILEAEVHPHSRLANKPLGSLKPRSWRAGILYRDGQIIVPKGDTRLKPRDRVVVMGDPNVVRTVADLLTFRFTRFPLEYGDTLVVWLEPRTAEPLLEELAYLLEIFPLNKLLSIQSQPDKQLAAQIERFAREQSLQQVDHVTASQNPIDTALPDASRQLGRRPGLVVLPDRTGNGQSRPWAKKTLRSLSEATATPLLLASGSYPYTRVAVPCLATVSARQALETTLEMALEVNYAIEALLVKTSPYISAPEDETAFEAMETAIADLALAYKRKVRTRILEGNPVEAVTASLGEHNLAVLSLADWSATGFWRGLLRPDAGWELVKRIPISCLLIPETDVFV